MSDKLIGLFQFFFAFGISAFALLKGWQEFLKSQLEKARMKGIDLETLKALMEGHKKIMSDIEVLKQNDQTHKEDIRKLEVDYSETIKKFLDNFLRQR